MRVGLFVDGRSGKDGRGLMTMTATSVITDRETLGKDPPDILLTNYKMLGYLLIRPKDRLLWAKNTPETLRYVVVDELHTFDDAEVEVIAPTRLSEPLQQELKAALTCYSAE